MVWGSAAGHCNTSAGVSPNCGDARGGLFDTSTSSTWQNGQEQFLGLDAALGYEGEGQYGMLFVFYITRKGGENADRV